jgi:hypothetical protein
MYNMTIALCVVGIAAIVLVRNPRLRRQLGRHLSLLGEWLAEVDVETREAT